MTLHDLALAVITLTLWAAVVIAAIATSDGGDYPPAPAEMRPPVTLPWQDYRDANVRGWEAMREANMSVPTTNTSAQGGRER